MKIHAIQTGSVAVTASFLVKKGRGLAARFHFLFDREYTSFLPIYCYVIEHPEGLILVDTGAAETISQSPPRGTLRLLERAFFNRIFRFSVRKEDTVAEQLVRMGLRPSMVRKIVLTHLHLDHVQGLRYFPQAMVYIHEAEYRRSFAAVRALFPGWLRPFNFSFEPNTDPDFGAAFPLTAMGDLYAVPAPGHTRGHVAVILRDGEERYLFAGDTTADQNALLGEVHAGADTDYRLSSGTYAKIRAFAARNRVVYLPAHDPDAARRLAERRYCTPLPAENIR